jgi:hypothetical protein
MLGSAKTLKRNNQESSGILIGPSMAPRFFRASEIPSPWVFHPLPKVGSRLRAQILRHGWQADDSTPVPLANCTERIVKDLRDTFRGGNA